MHSEACWSVSAEMNLDGKCVVYLSNISVHHGLEILPDFERTWRWHIKLSFFALQHRRTHRNLWEVWAGRLPRHHETTRSCLSDICHAGKCHNYWSCQKSKKSEKLHCNDMLQLVFNGRRQHDAGLHWSMSCMMMTSLDLDFGCAKNKVQETNICTTHSGRT